MPSVGHAYHQQLLEPLLRSKKSLVIYDFGCGAGELLELIPRTKIKKYVGVDINPRSITKAKQKYRSSKISFFVNEPTQIPHAQKQSVDVFIAVGVFQYLPHSLQKKVLTTAQRMLKKNGSLVLSCAVDHTFYKFLNIYKFFLPHGYINRTQLLKDIRESGFTLQYTKEKGLLLGPLFSNVVVFFFDAIDKLIFHTKGKLGPIGSNIRNICRPLLSIEYKLPIDYGYTLFVQAVKR